MTNQILVSIVIPVYNVEKYLYNCLDSVMAQSHTNIEVIVIDDGSTDQSGRICDEYALLYNRIKVIHQKNKGVSSARNCGLKLINGDYVCIIDSDDYLDKNYVSRMLQVMVDDNLDFVACGVYALEHEDGSCKFIKNSKDDSISDNIKTLKKLFTKDGFNGWGVNKLYKSSIIAENEIRYREDLKYCEDEVFCLEYLIHVNRSRFIKDNLYHYMDNQSSVNHAMYVKRQFNYNALDRLKADEICWEIVKGVGNVELSNIFLARRFRSNAITMDKFMTSYNGDKSTLAILSSNLRKYWLKHIVYDDVSVKKALSSLFMSLFPRAYYRIVKLRNI